MLDRFVTVAAFQDPMAANLAKNFLEDEGIPAILLDETTVATDWLLSGAIGGVKLQVAPIHVERAEMLLSQTPGTEDEDEADDDHPLAAQTAIASQEIAEDLRLEREDKEPINQLVDRLFRVVVLGMLFWPLQLYSIWLLWQLTQIPGTVSENRRWKAYACFLLAPIILVTLVLALTLGLPCMFAMP